MLVGLFAVSAVAGVNMGPAEMGFATGDDTGTGFDSIGVDDDFGGDGSFDPDPYEADPYDTDLDDYDDSGYEPDTYDDGDVSGTGLASTPLTGDAGVVLPYGETWARGVEDTFNAYFGGINGGDPEGAWTQLSASRQQQTSLDEFADAVRSSYDSDFVVQQASYAGGRADVWLEFTSTQAPELGPNPGEGCTEWSLDYVLVEQPGGTFLIDHVAGHGGTTGHTPC